MLYRRFLSSPADTESPSCCTEHLDRLLFGDPGNPLKNCDRSTLRPYVEWRYQHLEPALFETWQPGNIPFIGDSLSDIARCYDCLPDLPGTFNCGILGSRICDAHFIIDQLEESFRHRDRTFQPSHLVILIGTNDLLRSVIDTFNSFPDATREQYYSLFNRLVKFRDINQCEIIFRSIPPGEPMDPPPECPWAYHKNVEEFNRAVREANAFLYETCHDDRYGFKFIDEYDFFWDSETGTIRYPLYRGNGDYLHFGCEGYRLVFDNLRRYLYK